MPSFKEKITALLQSWIPVQRRTIYDQRSSPLSLASQLDIDTILAIFQEAEHGDVARLFALYRDILVADTHIQTEFGKRLLAVLGDVLSVQPGVKDKAEDEAAAVAARAMVQVPGWQGACAHLLSSTLYPVAVVEKVFAADVTGYRLAALIPVPFELLDFSTGRLKIRATDAAGLPTSELLDVDAARYIVHRAHLLPVPDFWGGPFRALVFWWFLGAMDRDSWGRFLERYGSPFLVGKYDQADDASRGVLERAFSQAAKLFGLVISKETEVEIMQAGAKDAGEAFELFHNTANKEKSKLILGQTMSADAQSTGIGQGASPLHGQVREDIRQFDAQGLATTLRDQLAMQFLRINGLTGTVKFVFGGESHDQAGSLGDLLAKLSTAGLQVTDEALPLLGEKFGFTIERSVKAPEMPPTPNMPALTRLLPLATDPLARAVLDRMSGGAPAALARQYRAASAPLRELIDAAQSPEEVVASVRALSIGWHPAETADLLTEALLTYAANGVIAAIPR